MKARILNVWMLTTMFVCSLHLTFVSCAREDKPVIVHHEGIVRTIFDATLSLSTDPRKFFRAPRFAAKYNFKIDSELDKALRTHPEVLKLLDVDNAVYQTADGLSGGFAKRFFEKIDDYKVTDFLYTSMKDYLHTSCHNGQFADILRGILETIVHLKVL